ncbi:MAG: serine hydrolase [Chloroflexi bacterium]|nr:serine hydrolase [Chloroflexota bacterium]
MVYTRNLKLSILVSMLILLALLIHAAPAPAQDSTRWPTAGWMTSTPEEQGVDSVRLAKMLAYVNDEDYNVQGVVVIRHGVMVAEAYRAPYTAETRHHIFSCTKSFSSALIGIAVAQGYIDGVDHPVVDFFPDLIPANLDENKESVTLGHLLTMSSGFEWRGGILENPELDDLWRSSDWVQYVLDRPMSDTPGERFVYNSGGSHLLSAIVQTTTGQTAEQFAAANLFVPLGITDWMWRSDPNGISTGGWGLHLAPRDLAKFGYLYLHGGLWDGQQIIPAQWVADSTRQQIKAGGQWLAEGYGYQWWIDAEGYFMALGYGGQYIIVAPERDLVAVFVSGLPTRQFSIPETLFASFILPATESTEPLPANPEGNAALQTAIDALANPTASVPELPEIARQISGQTYTLEANRMMNLHSLSLIFADDSAQMVIDGALTLAVGLDGRYRVTPIDGPGELPVMARGAWTRDTTFTLEVAQIGEAENLTIRLTFEDRALRVSMTENSSGNMERFEGKIAGA